MNNRNRKLVINSIKNENKTVILYEAPHKLKKTLEDIKQNIGDIKCVIAKELTKIHENFYRGNISSIIEDIGDPKGEYIILLDLKQNKLKEDEISKMSIEEQYNMYKMEGLEKKEIIKQIARNKKVPKNEIYQIFLNKD